MRNESTPVPHPVRGDSPPRVRGGDRIGSDLKTTTPPNPPDGGGSSEVKCPRCGVAPGEPCVDRNGHTRTIHAARPLKASDAPRVNRADVKNWVGWAAKHVSGESPLFAAQAAAILHYTGQTVTIAAVRARLKVTGRDAKTLSKDAVA